MSQTPDGARDVAMMATPDRWPVYPLLPLTRPNGSPFGEEAYLVAGHGLRVYLGNIYLANPATDRALDYADAGAVVADGWRVD